MINIMFWSDDFDPNDYVGKASKISKVQQKLVTDFLKAGERHNFQRGPAICRILNDRVMLGTCDVKNGPYNYPDECWYYIEEHQVWTHELDELLQYILMEMGRDEDPKSMGSVLTGNKLERISAWKVENLDGEGRTVISSNIVLRVENSTFQNPFCLVKPYSLLKITCLNGDVIYATEVSVATSTDEIRRREILSKLTAEEKRILGLT